MSEATAVIEGFAEEHGIPLREDAPEKLAQYTRLLLKANQAMNLIGPMPAEQVARELVGDSLMVLGLLGELGIGLTGPVADVGSGAGLPGIPLAIARPELEFHLIEPRDRRYRFLGMAIRRLKLENVTRHRARIEELELPPMGAAISRAFAPVPRWLDVAHGLVSAGGLVVVCASTADVEALDSLVLDGEGRARFDIAGQRNYGLEGAVDRTVVLLRRR